MILFESLATHSIETMALYCIIFEIVILVENRDFFIPTCIRDPR